MSDTTTQVCMMQASTYDNKQIKLISVIRNN